MLCLPTTAFGATDGGGALGTRAAPAVTAARFASLGESSSSSLSSARLRRRVPFLGLTVPGMSAASAADE